MCEMDRIMWPLVFALVTCSRAQYILDPETRQRLQEVFGEPDKVLDELDDSFGNGTDCICLPYFRCNVSNEVFSGMDYGNSSQMSSSCPGIFDWCCERGRVLKEKKPPHVGCGWTGARDTIDPRNVRDSRDIRYSKDVASEAEDNAAFSELPWLVAILVASAGDSWTPNEYIGGGSVIHPSVVLTAAHKVDGRDHSQIKCRAGEWDSRSAEELLPHQDRWIAKVTQHEGYARRFVTNSVALLFLKTPFDVTAPNVGVACVGRVAPAPGARCFGTGWGKRSHGAGKAYARVLKKVEVPVVSNAACEKELRLTHLGVSFSLHPSHLCAGAVGADTCTGDGGAPLVCPIGRSGQRYATFGMAAWGVGCGSTPAVYVHVPAARAWLGDVLQANGLATAYDYEDDA